MITLGYEVEHSVRTEKELNKRLRKLCGLIGGRMKMENGIIHEYSSPILSVYNRDAIELLEYIVSKHSKQTHVHGAYDNCSGSLHLHIGSVFDLGIDIKKQFNILQHNLFCLLPLMARYSIYKNGYCFFHFRKNVRFRLDCDDFDYYRVGANVFERSMKQFFDGWHSKEAWFVYNTKTLTVEVRANENICVFPSIRVFNHKLMPDEFIDKMAFVNKFPSPYIKIHKDEVIKLLWRVRSRIEYDSTTPKLRYVSWLIDKLEHAKNNEIWYSINSFAEFVEEYQISSILNMYKRFNRKRTPLFVGV